MLSEWELTTEENANGITIVSARTENRSARVPDEINGLPVTEIGRHAFSEGCGSLEELSLPPGIRRLGDYAFYGCLNLRSIRMHDSIESWGGGVFTNCRDMRALELTMTGPRFGSALAAFAQELAGELEITVRYTDGRTAKIVLPEYFEFSEERGNNQNVFFNYEIQGAGYTYHHCFEKRQLNFRIYDKLWADYMRRAYDMGCALRLALARLRWPVDLSESSSINYSSFIKKHAGEAILALTEGADSGALAFTLQMLASAPGEPLAPELAYAAADALALARERKNTEATALLLQFTRSNNKAKEKTFDL